MVRKGFSLVELTFVAGIVTSLSFSVYQAVKRGKTAQCLNNFKQIYQGLSMFVMDNGVLPDAKFFPSSPSDKNGIHYILRQYGVKGDIWFCPALPSQLNKYGTNYIWNDEVNNKNLDNLSSSTWLMTEMTAVSKRIPPPHTSGFGILYADGHAAVGPRVKFPEVKPTQKVEKIEVSEKKVEVKSVFPSKIALITESEIVAGKESLFKIYLVSTEGEKTTMMSGNFSIKTDDKKAKIPSSISVSEIAEEIKFKGTFYKAGKRWMKVRELNSGIEGVFEFIVKPGISKQFSFENLPSFFTAGKPHKIKLISTDKWGNRTKVSDVKCFLEDITESILPKKVKLKDGIWEGEITFTRSIENNTIFVSDGEITGKSEIFRVKSGKVEIVEMVSSDEAYAGKPLKIEVLVKDKFGNLCKEFEGELDIDIPPRAKISDKKIVFKKEDGGKKEMEITFFSSGTKKIKIYNENVKGEKEIYVNSGPLVSFSIDRIDTQIAGKPFDIFVRARDKWGNRVKGFILKDKSGTAKYVQRDFSAGMWMETIVITKAGENVIIIEDSFGHTGKSNVFLVKPASPVSFEIEGIPVAAEKGKEYKCKIIVKDKFGNVIEDYKGKIEIKKPESIFIKRKEKISEFSLIFTKKGYFNLYFEDKENNLKKEIKVFVFDAQPKEVKNETGSGK